MRILVTGSAGHLGEALVRSLRERGHEVTGLDLLPSPYTTHVGSVCDGDLVKQCVRGVDAVLHTATLHKPHVGTHSKQAFVDTNVSGTLNVLEAAAANPGVRVVFTSTTSAFGAALHPGPGDPAAWITEDVRPIPKNIYGATKVAAEGLCELFHRSRGLPCLVLRTSRFFPEEDDSESSRARYDDANLKANEYLYRRVELQDAVDAHLLAAERAEQVGFGRYLISATTPFLPEHLPRLRTDAGGVVDELFPHCARTYAKRGWRMFDGIGRVYVNARAREELGWTPRFDFAHVLDRLSKGHSLTSELAEAVGAKGYHLESFEDGPYPVEAVD